MKKVISDTQRGIVPIPVMSSGLTGNHIHDDSDQTETLHGEVSTEAENLRDRKKIALSQIIYVSTATEPLSPEDLQELLAVARQRNNNLGLTGLLLYSHGRFMQAIEGPESAVKKVFSLISNDGRHKNIDTLRFEKIETRAFPDWQMGFRDLTAEIESQPGISRFLEPDFDASHFQDCATESYRMMLAFRNQSNDQD